MRVDTAVTSGGSSGRPPATASGAQETDSQMTVEEGTSAEGGGVGTAGTTDFETDSQATQINQSQQTCIDPPSSAADGTTGSVSRQGVSPCAPSQSPVLMRQSDNGSVGGDAASSGRGMVMAPSGASPLARVIDANNLLQLIQIDTYLAQLNKQLRVGVPRNARDALDMAGKLPLALKAHSIGIPLHELNIDPAQAGGLLGKFDALVRRSGADIKGRAAAVVTGRSNSRGCGRGLPSSTSCLWRGVGTRRTGRTCTSSTTSSRLGTCHAPPSTGRWRVAVGRSAIKPRFKRSTIKRLVIKCNKTIPMMQGTTPARRRSRPTSPSAAVGAAGSGLTSSGSGSRT